MTQTEFEKWAFSIWENKSVGERLLIAADEIIHPKDQVIQAVPDTDEKHLAVARIALDFARRPAGFKFRAMFECWDQARLVREMY